MFWECCGYSINRPPTQLTGDEFERFHACTCIVQNKMSLMQIEMAYAINMPHSTLHYWIHHHLEDLSPELYSDVCKQFKENLEMRYEKRWKKEM